MEQANAARDRAGTAELLRAAQRGDRQAEECLVNANIALVHSIARRFRDRGHDYEDIFQIGCIGFVKAIRNFNLDYDVCFSTYAVPMIMGEIRRFLRDDGPIKISRSLKDKARRLMAASEQLKNRLQRDPTLNELAQAADIPPEEIPQVMEAMLPVGSIDDEVDVGGDNPVKAVDRIADDRQQPENHIDGIVIEQMLSALQARERRIIVMRYYQEKTQSEIAREIGVSQVQISRLESKILRKMRDMMAEEPEESML
ncbi:MAG: SigB/SigF/SigG family RNA polymerase sigma factor [Eubacteriales bacterium]|nr:SigB/SigF/SigG family RNA polymerase sigma factor [Eubacteriales bacterium]